MHDTQHAITGIDAVDDDAKAINVHHIVEHQLFTFHLAIDAVQVFFAACDVSTDAGVAYAGRDFTLNFIDDFAAVATSLFDCSFQCAVTHRVQGAKTPVFQFIFDVVNTEPIGDGRVEFQRFAGDTAAFLWF